MKKQPPQQSFEARGLRIDGRISGARSTAGAVAAAPHQLLFRFAQQALQALQGLGLGRGTHGRHHLPMQILGPARLATTDLTVMQFPDSIPKPGELQGTKVAEGGVGAEPQQPMLRRRGCQGRNQDRA